MKVFIVLATTSLPLFFTFSTSHAQEQAPKDVVITLNRFPCYGSCPYYSLKINAKGTVTFIPIHVGEHNKRIKGKSLRGQVSMEQLGRLIKEFEKIKFSSLPDRFGDFANYKTDSDCPEIGTDAPAVELSIFTKGRTKKVFHYLGCRGTQTLNSLTSLEVTVDEVANTSKWTSNIVWGKYGSVPPEPR